MMRRSASVCLAALVGVVGAIVPTSISAASSPVTASALTAAPPSSRSAFGEVAATALARATGSRVLVSRLRSESADTYANPDGTFTAEVSVDPVRVNQAGAWVDVDSRLVRNPDGSLSPRASSTPMRFSGGGTGPLATLVRGQVRASMTWPDALPVPEVHGNTAIYREVYPGVDLEVSASGTNMTQRLVVKNRAAAADPRVRSVSYGMNVTGGTRVPDGPDRFKILDAEGQMAFQSTAPLAWDSAGTGAAGAGSAPSSNAARTMPGSQSSVTATGGAAPGAGGSSGDTSGGTRDTPTEGDKVTNMPMVLGSNKVTVSPPTSLLDSASTVYPVMIDPTTAAGWASWAMVDAAYPTVSYFKYTDQDQGVGYQNFSAWSRKRLFYGLNTSAYRGTQVISAKFNAYEVYSATCAAGTVNAYQTNDTATNSTWNTQPARVSGVLSSFSTKAGRSDCKPGGTWGTWDVTAAVKQRVAANGNYVTLQLAGVSESSISSWMRFAGPSHPTANLRPSLSVTYNNPPAQTPTSNMKAPTEGTSCATSSSAPLRMNTTSSTNGMSAKFYDTNGGTLTPQFRVFSGTGSTVVATLPGTAFTAPAASWSAYQKRIFPSLTEGATYNWRVSVKDSNGASSVESGPCYFVKDTAAPAPPTITLAEGADQLLPANATSTKATFERSDAAKFNWWVGSAPQPVATASGGRATVTVPLAGVTVNTLKAQGVDTANNIGLFATTYLRKTVPREVSKFRINDPNPGRAEFGNKQDAVNPVLPPESWNLPLTSNHTLGDGRYAGCQTVEGAAPCDSNRALQFNGNPAGAVVDDHRPVRTDASLSLGAWVYLSENVSGMIINQDGTSGAYALAYDAATQRFSFSFGSGSTKVTAYDGLAAEPDALDSGLAPGARVGGWTYVVGTFTKPTSGSSYAQVIAGQRRLDDADTTTLGSLLPVVGPPVTVSWSPANSTGLFRIGGSSDGSSLKGRVDEITTWQTGISADDAAVTGVDQFLPE